MLDLALAVVNDIDAAVGALIPSERVYVDRPDDKTIPYLWVRDGQDLPGPYPSIPEYKAGEVLIDGWFRDRDVADAVQDRLSFLEAWMVAAQGNAVGITYRFGSSSVLVEPTAHHLVLRLTANYFDRGVAA